MGTVTREDICALQTEAGGCKALRGLLAHHHGQSFTTPENKESNWILLMGHLSALQQRMLETSHFELAERIRMMKIFMANNPSTEEHWGNLFLQLADIEHRFHHSPETA